MVGFDRYQRALPLAHIVASKRRLRHDAQAKSRFGPVALDAHGLLRRGKEREFA
jgi:hypothetical protein